MRVDRRQRYLGIYLDDHLMAAAAGTALARRAARENRGSRLGAVLDEVADEIAEDRETLRRLARVVGGRPSRGKQLLGTAAERVARLKANGRVLRYSPLSRMLELEALTVGITGKLELWQALSRALAGDGRVDTGELDRLADRARAQRARLEPWRLAAAEQALGRPRPSEGVAAR